VRSVSIVRICAFVLLVFPSQQRRFFTCFAGTKAQKLMLHTSTMYCSGGVLFFQVKKKRPSNFLRS
jgi:hypothetical protein